MSVEELIEYLKECNQDYTVYIKDSPYSHRKLDGVLQLDKQKKVVLIYDNDIPSEKLKKNNG